MTIDTIFLCFCEDCEQNDGISQPYFMSRGLMEFVENSKRALDLHDSRGKRTTGVFHNEMESATREVDKRRNPKALVSTDSKFC